MEKAIISLVFTVLLFSSCKKHLSEQDKENIKLKIALFNGSYGLKHALDSIDQRTKLTTAAMYLGKEKAEQMADSIIKESYKNRNIPYQPESDYYLTYEKFIDYCNEKKIDPMERIKLLPEEKSR